MVNLIFDEDVFVPKAVSLNAVIKTALWDFVDRILQNPDNPDLIGTERDGFRASQFTTGYALDWEVTRRRKVSIIELFSSGKPEEVKLWAIRELVPGKK
jgi:hypothetical protein